jgi:DNA uptake protein ComE-like DNA-binding protein
MKAAFLIITTVVLVASGTSDAAGQVGRNQGLLDPDIATEKELLALPHVNATLAKGILERRPFTSMLQLDSYLGQTLSKEQRAQLYARLFLPLNLNTASREEILLVPGVGARIAHEFEEYRPYRMIAQFRREIGKYVDDKEVARLEQYVFVPINLNTATDEAILTIPGLGQRMLREFKEYRPDKTMQQFRREIGKYVNEKEVARLERYVLQRSRELTQGCSPE